MANPLIVYHGGCPDGFCAAWVAQQALGDVDVHFGKYGDAPPNVMGRDVYILDFSYPREVLERMHADANSLQVIDHHDTAEQALAGLPYCKFDMNESGASLTWKHFFPDAEPPWIVQYIRDRDLWKFELPNSKQVSAATMALPKTFAAWGEFSQRTVDEVAIIGTGIRQHIESYIASALPMAFPVQLGSYTVACVNVPYPNVSDVLDALVDESCPIAMAFYWNKDRWAYSLRSRGDIHVGEIAKQWRGGGHKNAAGFTSGCQLIPEVVKAMVRASMRSDQEG